MQDALTVALPRLSAPWAYHGRVQIASDEVLAKRASEGDESAFEAATALFRQLDMPFYLAATLLEYGEWLVAQDRPSEAEPLVAEASDIFERLEAKPWLERIAAIAQMQQPQVPA